MLKTGVCSVTFRKFDVAEVIKLTAAAGLDGIEWGSDVHVPPGDPEWAAKVRRMTLDAGLQVLGCGSYFRCDNRSEIAPLIELAQALGAPAIRIWTGRKSHTLFSDEEREELAAVIRELCDAAGDILVTAEFHNNTYTDDPNAALDLIKLVNRRNFRTGFQLYRHLDNLANAELMEPLIANVHVYSYDHAPLAETADLWQKLLPVFDGQDRALLIEFVKDGSPEQFAADAFYLKKLVADHKFASRNAGVEWAFKLCSESDIVLLHEQIHSVGWQVNSDVLQMALKHGEIWCITFDGLIVGTAGFIRQNDERAWIVLVTVRPELRHRAIATKLMYKVLERSEKYNIRMLDASNMGENVYRQIGFKDCGKVLFYELEANNRSLIQQPGRNWQPIEEAHLPLPGTIADNPAFEFMYKNSPEFCRVLTEEGRITGWFIGREKGSSVHIGPVYAESTEIALDAFYEACRMLPERKLTLDIFDCENELLDAVIAAGATFHHSHVRQYYGNKKVPAALSGMRSSAGPDFG